MPRTNQLTPGDTKQAAYDEALCKYLALQQKASAVEDALRGLLACTKKLQSQRDYMPDNDQSREAIRAGWRAIHAIDGEI